MKQQTGKDIKYDFNGNNLKNIIVLKILVEEFTGKQKVIKKIWFNQVTNSGFFADNISCVNE